MGEGSAAHGPRAALRFAPGHGLCKPGSEAPVRPLGLPREKDKDTVEGRLHAFASLQHQASLSACHGACLKNGNPHARLKHPPAHASGDCLHFVAAVSRRFPSALQGLPVSRERRLKKKQLSSLTVLQPVLGRKRTKRLRQRLYNRSSKAKTILDIGYIALKILIDLPPSQR